MTDEESQRIERSFHDIGGDTGRHQFAVDKNGYAFHLPMHIARRNGIATNNLAGMDPV
mgnify:CR=1 FL=1